MRSAIERLLADTKSTSKRAIPVLAVPYMGDVGRRLCEEAAIHWLDLSGNASIRADGLVIEVRGNENRFKGPGRPSSSFSPKAARIARLLLMNPTRPLLQRELAEMANLDPGYTSKVVRTLTSEKLILRNGDGALVPRNPSLLLDAWSEDYAFDKHRIMRGHVSARNSDQVVKKIAASLKEVEAPHAATGLAGAWLLTRLATYRLTTFFVTEDGLEHLRNETGFREEERGANTWLVVPNDEGVFHGAAPKNGVMCAHPVQVYLDLLAHPERGQEAAQELRKRLLPGSET